jgi:hypothetical protein
VVIIVRDNMERKLVPYYRIWALFNISGEPLSRIRPAIDILLECCILGVD